MRLARRIARRANRKIAFTGVRSDVAAPNAAAALTDCDFLFLAADGHLARLIFNAITHQYLIPGVQVGTKIRADDATGDIRELVCHVRLVLPSAGCLRCNGLIDYARVQEESLDAREREQNRYIDEVPAPSVITLNALGAAQAATDFMLIATGLLDPRASLSFVRFYPRERKVGPIRPRRDPNCRDCGDTSRSRRARGDDRRLPVKQPRLS